MTGQPTRNSTAATALLLAVISVVWLAPVAKAQKSRPAARKKVSRIGNSNLTKGLTEFLDDLKAETGGNRKKASENKSTRKSRRGTASRKPRIPGYVKLAPETVLGRVGYEEILVKDLLWLVEPLVDRYASGLTRSQLDLLRRQTLAIYLNARVETLLLLREFERTVSEQKRHELHTSLTAYAEKKIADSYKFKSTDRLDSLLRASGKSYEELRDRIIHDLAPRIWLQAAIRKQIDVSRADVQLYYDRNIANFQTPAQVRWEQIIVRSDRFATGEAARAEILRMMEEISAGASLAEVARKSSHGFRAAQGGRYDWTSQGSLRSETIDSALFELPVGELSNVLQTEQGFHVIRVVDRRDESHTSLEEVHGEIEKLLRGEQLKLRTDLYKRDLRESVRIWTVLESAAPLESNQVKPRFTAQFAPGSHLVTVPVTIDNREYIFAVDTGASMCVLDVSFRAMLGEPLRSVDVRTPAKRIAVDKYRMPPAQLDSISMQFVRSVVCTDLAQLRQATAQNIYGILGMTFLRPFVIQIDPDRRMFSLYRHGDLPVESLGKPLPIECKPLPHVTVTLADGRSKPFVLDTGNNGSGGVTSELLAELEASGHAWLFSKSDVFTLSGISSSNLVQIDAVTLADFHHQDLILTEGRFSNLGMNYLSRFVMTLDFPARTVYLRKSRHFARQDRPPMCGIVLLQIDGQIVVHRLVENGPAARAGIQTGDIITHVNQISTAEMAFTKLWRVLRSEHGDTVEMRLKRGEKELAVDVILEDPRIKSPRTARR